MIGIPNTDPNVHVRVLYFSITIIIFLVHKLARARGNCAGGGENVLSTVLGRHQYPLDNVAVPTNTHLTVGMTFCPITFHVKFGDLYHSAFDLAFSF